MKTLYVADENESHLVLLETALKKHYHIFSASSASRLFSLLENDSPDMILLNSTLSDTSGIVVLSRLKAHSYYTQIPVMFLADASDPCSEADCFIAGAADYIRKPVSKVVLLYRIQIHLKSSDAIMTRLRAFHELQNNIVSILADLISNRDHITGGHTLRTSTYLGILLDEMARLHVYADEMRYWKAETIITSARLHDIGKIVISDTILNKPGRLDDNEFALIKMHTTEGEVIIDRIAAQAGSGAFLSHAKVFAGSHHERWDGKGYPHALEGNEIPLEGRILAVADVYDALVSARPYKQPLTAKEAEQIIMSESGGQFDPCIVSIFYHVRGQFEEVYRRSLTS